MEKGRYYMNFKKIKDFINLADSAMEAEEKSKKEEITKEEFDIIREYYTKMEHVVISLGVIVTIVLIIISFACQITLPLKIWLTLFVMGCTPVKQLKYKLKREEKEKEDRYKIINIRDSWK